MNARSTPREAPMQPPSDAMVFGPFRLVRSRRALERDGATLALSGRAFDILELLIDARDRVVSRQEIMDRVWSGVSVEPSNLSVQMSALRRVLDDAGPQPKLITTVAGRGYRFIGPLDGDAAAAEPAEPAAAAPAPIAPPARRRTRLLLAVAALAAALAAWAWSSRVRPPPRLSLVVMPFRNLSAEPAQDFLADAVSDDLTTDLSQIPRSVVIARQSADAYRGRAVSAGEVGRALGVRYLLEGSLLAEGALLHINAQLIDTASSAHLWAQRFDVPRDKIGAARTAIVDRIASVLAIELTRIEAARSQHDRPDNPDAIDLFFRARSITDHDDTLAGYREAQTLLERAIALAPDFADAQAELGDLLLRKVRASDDPSQPADLAGADAALTRALALSPRHPLALAARAHALTSRAASPRPPTAPAPRWTPTRTARRRRTCWPAAPWPRASCRRRPTRWPRWFNATRRVPPPASACCAWATCCFCKAAPQKPPSG